MHQRRGIVFAARVAYVTISDRGIWRLTLLASDRTNALFAMPIAANSHGIFKTCIGSCSGLSFANCSQKAGDVAYYLLLQVLPYRFSCP